jgi:hypothetical protein
MKSTISTFCVFFFAANLTIFAQEPVITKIAKFKPPVVQTFLGINTNGASVTKEEASQLVSFPLKITDAKKNVYPVESYQFLYKRKSVVQDEETGKKESTFTTVADRFRVTPLPQVWVDNIKGGFQKDEQLYFFDIVVHDNSGRKFSAPDLKITIQ